MAPPTSYPSWAYNAVQPAQIVTSLAAFNALPSPGPWGTVPFASAAPGSGVPFDPGFPDTDTRLQQSLVEQRITNILLQQGFNLPVDVDATGLRAEILATDASLTS